MDVSDIEESANIACLSLLPEKSKKRYEAAYKSFKNWCQSKTATAVSETLFLAYFHEKSALLKSPSSLWCEYSMLKSTLFIEENIDISKYPKLRAFLKRKNDGYRPKKSNVFNREDVNKFMLEAPDDMYLLMKVVMVMGVAGACRSNELCEMKMDNVIISQEVIIVTIPDSKNGMSRTFTVTKSDDTQNSIHNDFFGICIPLAYYSCILPDIFENRGKTFRTAYKFCTALIFILGILCNLSEIYKLYQLFTDENFIFDEVIRNYIITSYHLASLIRCKILKGKISKIMFKKVIKYEEKIYASKNSELITVYKQTTSFVRNTMAYYFALILVVIIFYIAAPAFRDPYIIHKGNVTIEIRQVPLSSWTPYDDQYWPCFIWTSAVGTYLTIFFVTSDLICFGFIMFGLCQIRILKYFIQNFDKYSKVLQKQHGFDLIHSSTILQRELIRMHEEIIEYVSEVNTTLRYMMLLDFLPSSVQIAGIIFQMMTNLSIIQCILLGQFVCTLIARIFIYCNSSHNLFEQSQNIASSWYETDWTEWPNYLKKNIVLCMIRAQKPLKITIADMQDLTLNTFLTILQGTYTYMMVLTTNSLKS